MKTLLSLLTLGFALSACAPAYKPMYQATSSHSFDETHTFDGTVTRSEKGFLAFQNGLYQFVKNQNCVKCHGAIVSPMFAHADVNTAYANAKTRVNFNDPDSSKFIAYAGNSHCGDTPCSNPANSAVVKPLIEAWAAAELSDAAAPAPTSTPTSTPTPGSAPVTVNKFVTGAVPVPANLPDLTVSAPGVIRFQLSQLNPAVPALANAILEIEIQKANATTYRLNRPKIVGNTAPVQLDGIHVFVKPNTVAGLGVEDQNQGLLWTQIAVTAQIAPLPAPLPAGPLAATPLQTKAIQVQVQSVNDVITVELDNLR